MDAKRLKDIRQRLDPDTTKHEHWYYGGRDCECGKECPEPHAHSGRAEWNDGKCLRCGFEHEHEWIPYDDTECVICSQWSIYLKAERQETDIRDLLAFAESVIGEKRRSEPEPYQFPGGDEYGA